MKNGYIYKITNPQGRIYIGQTKNIIKRISRYSKGYCTSQKMLHASINKYGWDKHVIEIVYTCDYQFLDFWETHFITFYNSYNLYNPKGMNLTVGGEGCRQDVVSEETRLKMSVSAKKRNHTGSKNNKSRLVINKSTGIYYESIREAAEAYGLTEGALRLRLFGLRTNNSDLFLCSNELILHSVKKPAVKKRKVVDIKTNNIYESTSVVARLLGIKTGLMRKYLMNILVNKTNYRFLDSKDKPVKMYDNTKIVLDTSTGVYFYSCKEAAANFNMCYSVLSSRLNGRKKNNTNLKYV